MTRLHHPLVAALWVAILAAPAFAGGGPTDVLVLVNDASQDSLDVANHYRLARGIPDGSFCHLRFEPKIQMEADEFEAAVLAPLRTWLTETPGAAPARFLVVTEGFPYRVHAWPGQKHFMGDDWVSVTAALATLDARAAPILHNPYRLQRTDWYQAAHAFRGTPQLRYLAIALMGDTVADVTRCIDQGARADGTRPAGTVYLFEGVGPRQRLTAGNPPRDQQQPLVDLLATRGVKAVKRPQHSLAAEQDVLGYFTGFTHVKTDGLGFLPGAIGDHLTSFGGIIKGKNGQMSCTRFLAAGATGTYGTVTEPTNIYLRFPEAFVFERYTRGFSLVESYWMAVGEPRIGIFVGEPLAAPFAVRPAVTVAGLDAREGVTGVAEWRLTVRSAGGHAIRSLATWLDGVPWPAGPTLTLAAGTRCVLRVGGVEAVAELPAGAGVAQAVAALAAAVPADAAVEARAEGARLTLRAKAAGPEGNALAWEFGATAPVGEGAAAPLAASLACAAPSGRLAGGAADERPRAFVTAKLAGTPAAGDRVTIARGDASVAVAADPGEDLQAFASRLLQALVQSDVVYRLTPAEQQAARVNLPIPYMALPTEIAFQLLSPKEAEEGNGEVFTIGFAPGAGSKLQVSPTGPATCAGGRTVPHHATATLAFDASCPAPDGAALTLDAATLVTGPHRLRVVVEEATDVATQGWVDVDFDVATEKGELKLAGPKPGATVSTAFKVTPQLYRAARGGSARARVLLDGRPVGGLTANRKPVLVDPAAIGLGRGRHTLVAELLEDDGRPFQRSAPLEFVWEPPAAAPPASPPGPKPGGGKGKGK